MDTKLCQSCNHTLPLEDFHLRTRAKDGRQTRCKTCNKEQRKAYYKTAYGKARNDSAGKRWGEQLLGKIYEYLLEHPCVDCGEKDPVVLEFDHQRDKEDNISSMIRRGMGWAKIQAEMAKCEVRCANCHKKKTAKDFGWYKYHRGLVPVVGVEPTTKSV